jgi:hypothetical protein
MTYTFNLIIPIVMDFPYTKVSDVIEAINSGVVDNSELALEASIAIRNNNFDIDNVQKE